MQIFYYLVTGSLLMIIFMILYLPIYFILRKKQIPVLKQLSWVLLGGVIFVILVATILLDVIAGGITFNPPVHHLNLMPFNWLFETWEMGRLKMISQVIGNILMFIPLGFLLPLVFKSLSSFKKNFQVIFFFSLSIEFIQYFIGRSSDIDDLILNTLGGMVGYTIYFIVFKLFSLKDKEELVDELEIKKSL